MRTLLWGGKVFLEGALKEADIALAGSRVEAVEPSIAPEGFDTIIACRGQVIVPGFVDVHVHLREPGFSYKETILTGTMAAARGGYTTVCSMPNLNPVPDSFENLKPQLDAIVQGAVIPVLPYGSITRAEQGITLSDFASLKPYVAGFSDDGKGVQNTELMREAMRRIKALSGLVVAHCEVEALTAEGRYAEAETAMLVRDIALVRETGCAYHACHIFSRESIQAVRAAKAEGLPVTCETAPQYLLLCDEDVEDNGRFRMNPAMGTRLDRDALVAALIDGTIDCIATDHAPHAESEKNRPFAESANGVVGLECAFQVLYTKLVQTHRVPFWRLIDALTKGPRRVMRLPAVTLAAGSPADLTCLDVGRTGTIDPSQFASMGRSTPFAGWAVEGAVVRTMVRGKTVWKEDIFVQNP